MDYFIDCGIWLGIDVDGCYLGVLRWVFLGWYFEYEIDELVGLLLLLLLYLFFCSVRLMSMNFD